MIDSISPHASVATQLPVPDAQVDTRDAASEVSRDFSALLLEQMLNVMRKTVPKEDNPLYGGLSQDIFEGFLYQEYAKILATSGNLGIDALVYQELSNS